MGGYPCCCDGSTAGNCTQCVDTPPGAVQISLSGVVVRATSDWTCTPGCTTLDGTFVLSDLTGTTLTGSTKDCWWGIDTTGLSCDYLGEPPPDYDCDRSYSEHRFYLASPVSAENHFDLVYRLQPKHFAEAGCGHHDINYFRIGYGEETDPDSATCSAWNSVSLTYLSSISDSTFAACDMSGATCTVTSL